ncbi:cation diffusion facilitator family transporter [Thermosporothrix hazakensis]|jgi:cation diffusion facilitator family transporter|uniref:Cation diffusion facilitator family transporter n=2 Tax=Thermosporothrix TaxID=768650 RepID=A0A326UBI8_THEHA|nr:cation diffusion facilitator family transporter [Thermosporothrix hazakensis]PZW34460.1 cation diffusion facilitator family transporter [Thermosporothrix hazakensis]BBH85583.1 transporter [Thermosporothrix sp. COM3]GCE45990.1 transporter [Thermosporothrix hazakensis]
MKHSTKQTYILLSVLAALVTMGVKFTGFLVTGSVGLFSDAAESVVNLIAALVALWALALAARPADKDHAYGHTKAEYFSSGVEGALILVAALMIIIEAIPRLMHPQPLENVGFGLLFSVIGALVNGGLAWVMWRAGKRMRSIALQADARHLFTDVLTTVGVLVGVILVPLTGWLILDPLIAIVVAINIVLASIGLLRETALGLLDTALPAEDQRQIQEILERYQKQGLAFHALRTRRSGARRFVSFHVLVPGSWTVAEGHTACEEIEHELREALPESTIFTHLEPYDDPVSWADQELDRLPEPVSQQKSDS